MTGPDQDGGRPRRAVVLQHLEVEHPAAIGDRLRGHGVELVTVELDAGDAVPDLEGFDIMIAMGGPMDIWQEDRHPWLVAEKAAIRHWVAELGRPFLGVCLGHQLLADALGGTVGPMAAAEVGVRSVDLAPAAASDAIFGPLAAGAGELEVLEWHGAEVKMPPPGAVVLAGNSDCAIQAIHVPPAAWGIQFHVEIDDALISAWADIPEYRASLESTVPGGAEALLGATRAALPRMLGYSTAVADRLVAITAAGTRNAGAADLCG